MHPIARQLFSLFQTAHIQSALRNGIWHAVRACRVAQAALAS